MNAPLSSEQEVALRVQAYLDSLKPEERYPPEIAQQRFERTLMNMLRTPPDPKNVRTKLQSKRLTAKRKMWSKEGLRKYWKAKGKSDQIERVFCKDIEGNELLEKIHQIVPREICCEVRNDLCQEILLCIIEGEYTLAQFTPKLVRKFQRAANAFRPHTELDYAHMAKKNLHYTGAHRTRGADYEQD